MLLIGQHILLARMRAGVTQEQLARRALLTRPNLSAIETGRRDLMVGTLCRIARALGMPPHALLLVPPNPSTTVDGRSRRAIIRAVVSGKRNLPKRLTPLADAVAYLCRPALVASGASAVRRGSRHALTVAQLSWTKSLLMSIFEDVKLHVFGVKPARPYARRGAPLLNTRGADRPGISKRA